MVFLARVLKVGGRIVAGPEFQLYVGPIYLDGQLAIASVARRIRAVEANGVVGRSVALHLRKGRSKIIGIEEGLATGVDAERGHDLLCGEVGVHIVCERAAVEGSCAAQAAGGGVAQRRNGLQASRIHAVDGQIGAHRGVDGCPQRSLVLDAVPLDAAGKVQQRFLLGNLFQRFCDSFQGKQFAVGVEVVVFALVGRIACRVFRLVGVCRCALGEALAFSSVVNGDLVDERLFVGGKILVHFERVAQRDQRHQVSGLHFIAQKLLRRRHAAVQVLGLHRGQVEEHDNQPVIAQVFWLGNNDGLVAAASGGQPADRGFAERRGHFHGFKIKGRNLLLLSVFEDAEIALLEPAHQLAGLRVARHHVGQHQFCIHLEHEAALRRVGDLRGG